MKGLIILILLIAPILARADNVKTIVYTSDNDTIIGKLLNQDSGSIMIRVEKANQENSYYFGKALNISKRNIVKIDTLRDSIKINFASQSTDDVPTTLPVRFSASDKFVALGDFHVFMGTLGLVLDGLGIIGVIVQVNLQKSDWNSWNTIGMILNVAPVPLFIWEIRLGKKLQQ